MAPAKVLSLVNMVLEYLEGKGTSPIGISSLYAGILRKTSEDVVLQSSQPIISRSTDRRPMTSRVCRPIRTTTRDL